MECSRASSYKLIQDYCDAHKKRHTTSAKRERAMAVLRASLQRHMVYFIEGGNPAVVRAEMRATIITLQGKG